MFVFTDNLKGSCFCQIRGYINVTTSHPWLSKGFVQTIMLNNHSL